MRRAEEARQFVAAMPEIKRLNPDDAETVLIYCEQIPNSVRRAITRPYDGGRPTALLSQLPMGRVDMARFLPPHPPRMRRGTMVPGDLELEQLLGQGTFGEVWPARSLHLDDASALKFCLDPELSASLRRETKLLAMVEKAGGHENVVRIETTNLYQDPPFLQPEYIDGCDLLQWAAQYDGKPVPLRDVLKILR